MKMIRTSSASVFKEYETNEMKAESFLYHKKEDPIDNICPAEKRDLWKG